MNKSQYQAVLIFTYAPIASFIVLSTMFLENLWTFHTQKLQKTEDVVIWRYHSWYQVI